MLRQCLDANPADRQAMSTATLTVAKQKRTQPKKITMSGLLNGIDGAASVEGRLLTMSPNHPDDLDEALTRPGRWDHRVHIGYATKFSAEQTLNRIFGTDPNRIHKLSAINRFAEASKEQFPTNSEITTASLVFNCAMCFNRPADAVKNFAEWLEVGDEIFHYTIKALPTVADKGIDVAEPFDANLLASSPEDYRPSRVAGSSLTDTTQRSTKRWTLNPLRLLLGDTSSVQKKPVAPQERMMPTTLQEPSTPCGDPDGPVPDSLFSAFDLKAILAADQEARDTGRSTESESYRNQNQSDEWSDDDFADELLDFTLADPIPSMLPSRQASPSPVSQDETEDDDALDPPLSASVKIVPKEGQKLVAPCPLEELASAPAEPSPTWSSGTTATSDDLDTKYSSSVASRTSLALSLKSPSESSKRPEDDMSGDANGHNNWHGLDLVTMATGSNSSQSQSESMVCVHSETANDVEIEGPEVTDQASIAAPAALHSETGDDIETEGHHATNQTNIASPTALLSSSAMDHNEDHDNDVFLDALEDHEG